MNMRSPNDEEGLRHHAEDFGHVVYRLQNELEPAKEMPE